MSIAKCSPTTPQQHATMVWALPFSLATTWGIIIIFFSSRYLDVSVPWVGSPIAWSDAPSAHQVVPFGNLRIYRSCAAPRSLSQLTTSFIVSQSQGIHHVPLIALKKLKTRICYSCSLLPDHIASRPPLKIVCQKNHCDRYKIIRYSSNNFSQYVKELFQPLKANWRVDVEIMNLKT